MKKLNVKLKIKYDNSKPDGCQKCLDIKRAKKYGWKPKNDFDHAFKLTYDYFEKCDQIKYLVIFISNKTL